MLKFQEKLKTVYIFFLGKNTLLVRNIKLFNLN